MSLSDLVEAWAPLRDYVTPEVRPVLDVPAVVALERAIAAQGTPLAELMDRAGNWLAFRVHKRDPKARIVVLAGSGNNGGDGWVAARELRRYGHDVCLVSSREPDEITAQPARDTALAIADALAHDDVRMLVRPDGASVREVLLGADIIVDALLGTGFAHDALRDPLGEWVAAANECRARGAHIVSADCPSGLNAQTGAAAEPCVCADETVTMIVGKTGLSRDAGPAHCGRITIAPLCDI